MDFFVECTYLCGMINLKETRSKDKMTAKDMDKTNMEINMQKQMESKPVFMLIEQMDLSRCSNERIKNYLRNHIETFAGIESCEAPDDPNPMDYLILLENEGVTWCEQRSDCKSQ